MRFKRTNGNTEKKRRLKLNASVRKFVNLRKNMSVREVSLAEEIWRSFTKT